MAEEYKAGCRGNASHRNRKRLVRPPSTRSSRSLGFENLEFRLLLAADSIQEVSYATSSIGRDLLLQVNQETNKLQLVDLGNGSTVIEESDLSSDAPFIISGTAGGDRLQIDFLAPFTYLGDIHFDAGGGRDEIELGVGYLEELHFEARDIIPGVFDVQFGGNVVLTSGLEEFTQHGAVAKVSFEGSSLDDSWAIYQSEDDQLAVDGFGGFARSMRLQTPLAELALNTHGGNDYVSVYDLQLQGVDLSIQGEGGDDTIELTDVYALRSDISIGSGAGNDTLLIDRTELSQSDLVLDGGENADQLVVARILSEQSNLEIYGGIGEDTITLAGNLLRQSNVDVQGGDGGTSNYAADFDNDGDVDTDDYLKWKVSFGKGDAGDANNDGVTNIADYTVWRDTLGSGEDDDSIVVSQLVLEQSSSVMHGGDGEDYLSIDQIEGDGLQLYGDRGIDSLQGPLAGAAWVVTGVDAGTVDGLLFEGVEQLIGADGATDHFVVASHGSLSGVIEGGLAGDDILVVEGHANGPHELHHRVTGPQTGKLTTAGGEVSHQHSGFETVEFGIESTSQVVELSAGANVTLTQDSEGNLVTVVQHAFDADTDLSSADETAGFVVTGSDGGAAPQNVSSVGDINADGIADFVIGQPELDRAYVVFGDASGFSYEFDLDDLDGSNGFELIGSAGRNTGYSVSGGGDVNGDGIGDLILGAPGPVDNSTAGVSYVVFGRDTPFDASLDLTTLNGSDGFALQGISTGDAAGASVAIVRDINGDDIDEILIGAPGADPDASRVDAGQAYLVMGSDKGFAPSVSLAALDGISGFVLSGSSAGDQAGASVADAGDLNSDGVGDVVVGAPGADPNGEDSGAAYVFFGAADFAVAEGLTGAFYETGNVSSLAEATTAIVGLPPSSTFDAYQVDYPNGDATDSIEISTELGDYLGLNAENIDGDDTAAIAGTVFTFSGYLRVDEAGAYNFQVGSADGFSLSIDGQTVAEFDGTREFATSTGSHTFAEPGFYPVLLLHFSSSSPAGLEWKSDLTGTLDFVTREQLYTAPPTSSWELGELDGSNGLMIAGGAAGDALGAAVASAGDLNGDGPEDLVVGAPGSDAGGADSGQAYVLYGKPITTLDEGFSSIVQATHLSGSDGLILSGSEPGRAVGSSVASAGDINADGLADLLLGAPGSATLAGEVHVVFGSPDVATNGATDLATLDGVVGFTASAGASGDLLGSAVAAAGDVNDDGIGDVLISAPGEGGDVHVLLGRAVGGAASTISYTLPTSAFTIEGEDASAQITIGNAQESFELGDSIDANHIDFDGADFFAKGRTITVQQDVVISTRQMAEDGDPETAMSTGNSGDIVLKATYGGKLGGNARIDVRKGASLFSHVEEESTFAAGGVSITADHVTTSPNVPLANLFEEGARTATIDIRQGVTILGGDVDIASSAGIRDLESLMRNSAAGIGGLVAEGVFKKWVQLLDLPLSIQVSIVNSTVDIGATAGDEVRIEGSESVSIDASAAAEARGDALFWTNPLSPGSSWGLAFGLWIADATSKVTLHENVTVESLEDDVAISADSTVKAGGSARVSQNLDQGLSDENGVPANPNNVALSVGLGITNTTAKVHVKSGASVIADAGNVSITADGEDEVKVYPETRSYEGGRFGVTFGFQESTDDIRALVNGTIRSGGAKAGKELTFDPFTAINTSADTINVGADHGYTTGDKVFYSSELGGPIDGLERSAEYYVIVDEADDTLIQLAETAEDAADGNAIDLVANPTLTATDNSNPDLLPFSVVGDESDWIDFGFPHGFAEGDVVKYTAADGKNVGGLSDGVSYYVVLVDADDDPDGHLLRLSTDPNGASYIDLDTDIRFTDTGSSNVLVVDSVDAGPGTITFTTAHGLTAGDPISYHPALGFQLNDGFTEERFVEGTTFYAIPSPDPDESNQIRLALTADDATASNGYTNAVAFDVDQTVMTGTAHSLSPKTGSGITIAAAMDGNHSIESKARIGGKEGPLKQWTRPEFTQAATSLRQSLYATLDNPDLDGPQNGNPEDGLNVDSGQDSLDLSSSIAYQDLNRTVEAVIGSDAVLFSGTDISVTATAEETGNVIVEAGATQSKKQNIKIAIGASFSLVTMTTEVRAVVNSGAELDASDEMAVEAENVRRFPAEVDSPEDFENGLLTEFLANPTEVLGDLNKSLLHPLFTTGWSYTRAAPGNADTAVGFSFQFSSYDNTTEAIIADAALVNQDESYRTDDQEVSVSALNELHLVNMAGVAEIGLNPAKAATALLNKARGLQKESSVLPEAGVEGKDVAIGTSFQWTDVKNEVLASVGGNSPVDDQGDKASSPDVSFAAAQVHTGVDGKLTVDAEEELWFFSFVDTGAKTESGSVAFAGSGSLLRHNFDGEKVRARIAAGSIVSGGSVDVDASDSLILVGQNGSFITGENTRGVGVGVNYWDIHRKVFAYIGDLDGEDLDGSTFELDADSTIDVEAKSDGYAVSFALASVLPTASEEENDDGGHVNGPEPVDEDAPNGSEENAVGQGVNAGKSGWSLAADVSFVDINKDQVWAFIDDTGTFNAQSVSVKAANLNSYINLAGAFAVTASDFESSSNNGLAGSFSAISIERGAIDSLGRGDSDTLAYIRRATLDIGAGGLDIKSHRRGTYSASAAGGAGTARGEGFNAAGSAALNDLDYATRAYIEDVPTLLLAGDSSIEATDRVTTLAVAGDVVWNGSIGFGTSWAWNEVDRRIHATITNSTIEQSNGELSIDAVLWDVSANDGSALLPNAFAVAGTLGKGNAQTTTELTGTVAVNDFNTNISSNAVEASMSDSSYAWTGDTGGGVGLSLTATDNSNLLAFAGGIDLGAKFTLGVAAAVNELDNHAVVSIEDSNVSLDSGDILLAADVNPEMNAFALGVTVTDQASGLAVAGSGASNRTDLLADAHVIGAIDSNNETNTNLTGADNVTVEAKIKYTDVAAGAGQFGLQTFENLGDEFGAAVAVNDLAGTDVKAYVEDAAIDASEDVQINAMTTMADNGVILGLAVGLEKAQDFVLGGSVVKNHAGVTTDAHVSGDYTIVTAGGDIAIVASEEDLVVSAGAGVINSASEAGAVGAAVPTNLVNSTSRAYVEQAAITATGDVSIAADRKDPQIIAVAFGGENAQSFSFGGSIATNDVTHVTDAHVSGGSSVAGDSGVSVIATEQSPTIVAAAGNYSAASQGVAIGAAVPTNSVKRELRAYVGNKDSDSFSDGVDGVSVNASAGEIEINASRTQSLVLAIGVGGVGAETFSLGGSAATNGIDSSVVDAHVWGGNLDAANDVKIHANDVQATQAVGAGNLDLSYLFESSGGSGDESAVNGRDFVPEAGQLAVDDGVGVDNVDEQAENIDQLQNGMENQDPVEEAQNEAGSLSELQENLNDVVNGDEVESILQSASSTAELNQSHTPATIGSGQAAAGELGASTGVSVGIALANNLATDSTVTAFASDAMLNSASQSIDIRSRQNALLVTIAGSGSLSADDVALDATEATTDYSPTTTAYIDAASSTTRSEATAAGNVLINADSNMHAVTVAGNIAFNTAGTSIAGSVATLKHTDVTKATIDNANIQALGAGSASSVSTGEDLTHSTNDQFYGVSVTATSAETITTVAAGIELSGKATNAAASISVNLLDETTTAKIHTNSTINAGISPANEIGVNVFAWSDTVTHGGGGAVGLSGGETFGGGISSDTGDMTKTTIAALESANPIPVDEGDDPAAASVNATDTVSVQALSSEKVVSYEGTLEVSKEIAVAATTGVQLLDLTTEAYIGASDNSFQTSVDTDGSVIVASDDTTAVHVLAGSVAIAAGGAASVGASFGDVHLAKHTTSKIVAGSKVTARGKSSRSAISAAKDGFEVSYEEPDGDPTEVQPPGIVTNDLIGVGQAPVDDPAYTKTRSTSANLTSMRGVAVTAAGRDTVKGTTFSGGGAKQGALDLAILVRTGTTNTTAEINGDVSADSEDSSDALQDVLVSASHDYHQLSVVGELAISGESSVTPGVSWATPTFNTSASVGDSAMVSSSADTIIGATGAEHLTVVSAGVAGGTQIAFDAQIALSQLTTNVTAQIGAGATVRAGGNVVVGATDDTHATHVAGGAAVAIGAGSVGVGASFVYFDVDKTTSALIGDDAVVDAAANSSATVDAIEGSVTKSGDFAIRSIHGVSVQAQSSENIESFAVSGDAGLYAGVGGGMLYTHVHSDTNALVGDRVAINQSPGDFSNDQSVSVAASNDASVTNYAGGLVVGIGALSGAIDMGIVRNNTTARIGTDSKVKATNDVDVHAVSRKDVNSTSLSSADGALGIGGSVSVWTLGKKLESAFDTVSTSGNDALAVQSSGGQNPQFNSFGSYGDGQASRTDASSALASYDTDSDGPQGTLLAASIAGEASDNMVAATPAGSVSKALSEDVTADTTAEILGGDDASIISGDDLRVSSAERTDLQAFTGSFNLDAVGFGASVGVAQVRGGAVARIAGRINVAGTIDVNADSSSDLDNRAILAEGALIAVGAGVAVVEDHSIQEAEIADGAIIESADSVTIGANRDYDNFKSRSLLVEVGGAVAGASVAQAKVFGATQASVGDVNFSGDAEIPYVGDLTITANSKASPLAQADAVSVGLIAGDGNRADAVVEPIVDAHAGSSGEDGNLIALLSGDMEIVANSSAEPDAEAFGVAVSELGAAIGVSQTKATASPTVRAYVADDAVIDLPGITALPIVNPGFEDFVLADSQFTSATGGGIVTPDPIPGWTLGSGSAPAGTFNPTSNSYLDGAPEGENVAYSSGNSFSQILTPLLVANTEYTLSVDVGNRNETSFADYTIQLLAGDVVLIEDNSLLSPAAGTFETSVLSYTASPSDENLGQPLQVVLSADGQQVNFDDVRLTSYRTDAEVGQLKITANTAEDPTSHGRASGGSTIAAGFGVDSQVNIKPDVSAYIGSGANVHANLDVLVKADDTWVGTAIASGDDFAGLAVNQNNAATTIEPNVTAYISAKSIESNKGAVTVLAESGEAGSLPELAFTADSAHIDFSANTITFAEPHNLETGDTVIYDASGNGAVGGLEDGEAYTVFRVNDKTIKFVYQFDSADVDPATSYIYSDTPHGIETGSPVIYENNGLSNIQNLSNGTRYYVSAVDPHNLRLAATQDIAENLHETPFNIAQALDDSANRLQLNTVFSGVGHRGKADNNEHHIILDEAPGWSDGQLVYYFASDGETISKLTLGQAYYAFTEDKSHNYTIATDPQGNNKIKFSDNHHGNFVTPTSSWRVAGESMNSPSVYFDQSAVNAANNTITFTGQPPIADGDIVGFQVFSGTGDVSLSPDLYYYADVSDSSGETVIRLALSQSDLNNGNYIDLELRNGDGQFALTRPFAISTGDPLTYRAPLQVRFTAEDLQAGKLVIQSDEAPTLFRDLVAYVDVGSDSDPPTLTYDIVSTFDGADAINELTEGQQYEFLVEQTDTFELTVTLYSLDDNPLSLSSDEDPSTGTPTDHLLTMKGHSALKGLSDGDTYYMIVDSSHPGQVRLATSPANASNGTHVILTDPGGRVQADNGGTHMLGLEGIGIAPPTSNTGVQQLTIDLSNSGTSGTHHFVQAGPTEGVDTITGKPTVRAHGLNGNLVGGVGTKANATVKPVVTAFVGSPDGADTAVDTSITAADFFMQSLANADVKAESIGYDVSILAGGGAAFSTVNMLNTSNAYVGAGASINVNGGSTIKATSAENVQASTDMKAGGAVDVANTEADINIGRDTSVTLGNGTDSSAVVINAGDANTIAAESTTTGTGVGKAHAHGVVEIAVPHVEFKVGHGDYPAATAVNLGDHASLSGKTLTVTSTASDPQLQASTTARTGDLFGGSNLDSELLVKDYANLNIGDSVTSSTTDGKTVSATLSFAPTDSSEKHNISATSHAKSKTLVGGDYAAATTSVDGGVVLEGQFDDGSDDYLNYQLTVDVPSDALHEKHESITYYLWFIKDKHEGGSPNNDAGVISDPNPVAAASSQIAVLADSTPAVSQLLTSDNSLTDLDKSSLAATTCSAIVVSPDMFPLDHHFLQHHQSNTMRVTPVASSRTVDVIFQTSEVFIEAQIAAMEQQSLLLGSPKTPARLDVSPEAATQLDYRELLEGRNSTQSRTNDLLFGDSSRDWWRPFDGRWE